ncbi:hypothetical protein STEG23_031408, partial [Scotinomys teguina]
MKTSLCGEGIQESRTESKTPAHGWKVLPTFKAGLSTSINLSGEPFTGLSKGILP